MDRDEIVLLSKAYGPIIDKIIKDNLAYYGFFETIKYCFDWIEDMSIMAKCNRKTNIITINLKSFMDSYFKHDLLTIEYYLLHEIRHIFQHLIMLDYNNHIEIPISEEIVKKWIRESENYSESVDEEGNVNPNYFKQDSEIDAYAFSLAVMRYKYKNDKIKHLYVPELIENDKEFIGIIEDWINYFKKEGISQC